MDEPGKPVYWTPEMPILVDQRSEMPGMNLGIPTFAHQMKYNVFDQLCLVRSSLRLRCALAQASLARQASAVLQCDQCSP
jgi:hypothetical protein